MHLNHSLNIKRLFPVVLFCLLATINSCKKTNFVDETITADPAINDAKLWYESLYPKLVTANIKATATQGVGASPILASYSNLTGNTVSLINGLAQTL